MINCPLSILILASESSAVATIRIGLSASVKPGVISPAKMDQVLSASFISGTKSPLPSTLTVKLAVKSSIKPVSSGLVIDVPILSTNRVGAVPSSLNSLVVTSVESPKSLAPLTSTSYTPSSSGGSIRPAAKVHVLSRLFVAIYTSLSISTLTSAKTSFTVPVSSGLLSFVTSVSTVTSGAL